LSDRINNELLIINQPVGWQVWQRYGKKEYYFPTCCRKTLCRQAQNELLMMKIFLTLIGLFVASLTFSQTGENNNCLLTIRKGKVENKTNKPFELYQLH